MNLKIYKRGQGKHTRLGTGLVCLVIAVYGALILNQRLGALTDNVWIETLIPFGVAAAFGGLIWWLSNVPAVANFLIAAEGEIKKVSWSSRREIFTSTLVVITVVVVMSVGIGVWDVVLSFFFGDIIRLY